MFLVLPFNLAVLLSQELLFLVDLGKDDLAEVCSEFLRASRLVDLDKFFDFVGEFDSEVFVFGGDLDVLFL